MNGDIKIHGGDFVSGIMDNNQYVYGFFLLKVPGKLLREKIPISFVSQLEIATEESVKKLGGTLGWGLVGVTLLGPVGLLAGLLAGGKRNEVTFTCVFRDGRKFIATVSSKLYKAMMGDILSSIGNNNITGNLSASQFAQRNERNDHLNKISDIISEHDFVLCKNCGAKNLDTSINCWSCTENLSVKWKGLNATAKIAWVFGVVILLLGLSNFMEAPLPGLSLIVVAALLLPPIRNYVYSKTNLKLPVVVRVILILLLLASFSHYARPIKERKDQELTAHNAQEEAQREVKSHQESVGSEFINDKGELDEAALVERVKKLINERDYEIAYKLGSLKKVGKNAELDSYMDQARDKIKEGLEAEIERQPLDWYDRKASLYKRLIELYPQSAEYKNKYEREMQNGKARSNPVDSSKENKEISSLDQITDKCSKYVVATSPKHPVSSPAELEMLYMKLYNCMQSEIGKK